MKNNIFKLVKIALFSAILVISKEILAFLPNVELVSFLLILIACHMSLKESLMIATCFCFIQMLLYGFGEWTPIYFLVWNGLVLVVKLIPFHSKHLLALISGLFGLTFGLYFSLPYLFLSFETALAYWIKGLFFDLIHCLGNYLIMMLLYDRMNSLMETFLTSEDTL